jgi:hypothetical protein
VNKYPERNRSSNALTSFALRLIKMVFNFLQSYKTVSSEKYVLRLADTMFAGHKYPSITEKYRQEGVETLKAAVGKHHPFGAGNLIQ